MALEALLERINPSKYIRELSRRQDLTWDLIQKYPTLSWSSKALSRLAPLAYITQHPDKTWDYSEISKRKDLTSDFLRHYRTNLDWWFISYDINFQDASDNLDLPWHYEALSLNRNIKSDDLIEYPTLPWDYTKLSEHIDLDFVYANKELPWDYYELSKRISLDFICQNPQYDCDYFMLSVNPNITIDFILEHLDNPWEWSEITYRSDLDDILKYPQCEWDFEVIQSKYPDYCLDNRDHLTLDRHIISEYASIDYIKKYPTFPWNYLKLSKNPNITIDFILENSTKPWDFNVIQTKFPDECIENLKDLNWEIISQYVSLDTIKKYPTLPWNYSKVSINPGITLQDILDNWDLPWNILNIIQYKY